MDESTATLLSVVIPAFNEAAYLPVYLPTVVASLRYWERCSGARGEILVVDDASTDDTAQVARGLGARVVVEHVRNIAAVRNAGAAVASGRYLFFVDADVALPVEAISAAMRLMADGAHVGGAIPPRYRCRKLGARLLCRYWDWQRERHGGAQGVAQFCTAAAFAQLGGYHEELYMSEDHEFFARLRALGQRTAAPVAIVDELRVEPSTRRYDRWPTWRMVWWQNPITARLFLNSPRFWRHWYATTVR
jgi:glycosyltransferase involved in cell wall biosynthesis